MQKRIKIINILEESSSDDGNATFSDYTIGDILREEGSKVLKEIIRDIESDSK